MRKLLVFVALFAMVGVSYAQESVSRSVGVYFDAYSGDANNDAFASGNCFEFGVSYAQNFSSAQWLKMTVTGLTAVKQSTVRQIDGENLNWLGNSSKDTSMATAPRVKLHLNFGGFGYAWADTRSVIGVGGGYGHSFGDAGKVSYGADVEFVAVPTIGGEDVTGSLDSGILGDVDYTTKNLDLFQVHVGYSVPFAEAWGFTTKLMFRFSDDADADAFVDSFRIRWDNTVSYNVDGLGLWGRVRYQIDNIANDVDVLNQVYLQAGISYGFDFSNN